MKFETKKTSLDGVYKILLENFSDDRGKIINLFDKEQFPKFKIDKLTRSSKNVLRGLHGDTINDKLIYCLQGKIFLVVVNYDEKSEQFLNKVEIEMSENSDFAVFVPRNFLNGHYCMSDTCLFFYKWSESYVPPEKQFSVMWNDNDLNINWPLLNGDPVLSLRDQKSKKIKEQ